MAMHLFFALAAILLAAAGISLLSAQSSSAGFSFGLVGWSLMVLLSVLLAVLALIEATAQGYTAAVGDIRNFEITYEISRGFELVLFSLWPIAFAAIVLDDLSARAQLVPSWASGLALVGCVLLLVAVNTTSGLRIVDLGPLWAAGMLPAGWLLWQSLSLGFRGATKRTTGVGLAASNRSGE